MHDCVNTCGLIILGFDRLDIFALISVIVLFVALYWVGLN